jgi:hypothetical protein
MERQRSRKEFGITFEEALKHPELREQYFSERIAAIRAGESVWMVRGFSGLEAASEDEVPVFNYYTEGQHRGFIEGNERYGYQVYAPPLEEGERPHHLNAEPVELFNEAQKSLEDYIKDTTLSG